MPLDRITATFMLPYVDHRGGRAERHGARRLVNKPIRVRQSALFVRDRDTLGVTRYPGPQGKIEINVRLSGARIAGGPGRVNEEAGGVLCA